jgi:hypothetical protein
MSKLPSGSQYFYPQHPRGGVRNERDFKVPLGGFRGEKIKEYGPFQRISVT